VFGPAGSGSFVVVSPTTRAPWRIMAGDPLRFLASAWPWRSLAYLLSGSVVGLTCMIVVAALALNGTVLTLALVGTVLLLALVLLGIPIAGLERLRLRLIDPVPLSGGHRAPEAPGPVEWLRTRLAEWATWRELTYTLLMATALWPIGVLVAGGFPLLVGGLLFAAAATLVQPHTTATLLAFSATGPSATAIAVILAVLITVVGAYVVTGVAAGHATIARLLLSGREERLGAQLTEVSQSRRRLVDAFDAERWRIERDLHDGAQQRLVSLAMKLSMARIAFADADADGAAAGLVAEAHQDAREALAELREVVHGIHPQLLTDRGLPPALAELARRSPIPASVDVQLPDRLPATVESTAYFVVSEALTNVVKHAKACRVRIRCRLDGETLTIEVEDDGIGGADPRTSSGLQGLLDRAAVVDGALTVISPAGGPTVLRLTVPAVRASR
jgi:signal transduction histidine kinase